jgi:hypothetical protein
MKDLKLNRGLVHIKCDCKCDSELLICDLTKGFADINITDKKVSTGIVLNPKQIKKVIEYLNEL